MSDRHTGSAAQNAARELRSAVLEIESALYVARHPAKIQNALEAIQARLTTALAHLAAREACACGYEWGTSSWGECMTRGACPSCGASGASASEGRSPDPGRVAGVSNSPDEDTGYHPSGCRCESCLEYERVAGVGEARPAPDYRRVLVPSRDECEEMLDTLNDALGCIDPGRGNREYAEAKKALSTLRDVLDVDAVGEARPAEPPHPPNWPDSHDPAGPPSTDELLGERSAVPGENGRYYRKWARSQAEVRRLREREAAAWQAVDDLRRDTVPREVFDAKAREWIALYDDEQKRRRQSEQLAGRLREQLDAAREALDLVDAPYPLDVFPDRTPEQRDAIFAAMRAVDKHATEWFYAHVARDRGRVARAVLGVAPPPSGSAQEQRAPDGDSKLPAQPMVGRPPESGRRPASEADTAGREGHPPCPLPRAWRDL